MNIRDYYETHIILEDEQDVTEVDIICKSFGLDGRTYCMDTKSYTYSDAFIDERWYGAWPKESNFKKLRAKTFIERYYEHQ